MRKPTAREHALSQLELTALGLNAFDKRLNGLKFGEPDIPMGKLHETKFHMQHRYEEGIIQLTKLLMRDGKLSKAQRVSGPQLWLMSRVGALAVESGAGTSLGPSEANKCHRTWP